MNYNVGDFYRVIDDFAPFSIIEDRDNVGLLVGSAKTEVTAALAALDLTSDLLDEAKRIGANLIITHHPVIYPSLKRICGESLLYRAIREDIAVISAHTNYDKAKNGVNDALAAVLKLQNIRTLESAELKGIGRLGELAAPMTSTEYAAFVKKELCVNCVKHTQGTLITTVAVAGGSCAELWTDALAAGAQAFVTAEVKHHFLLAARESGFTLIDAGHFSTEVIAVAPLVKRISQALPGVRVILSETQTDPANYT